VDLDAEPEGRFEEVTFLGRGLLATSDFLGVYGLGVRDGSFVGSRYTLSFCAVEVAGPIPRRTGRLEGLLALSVI